MIITIDCRMWGKNYGGIGRYIQEVTLNILKKKNWSFILIISDDSVKQDIVKLNKSNDLQLFFVLAKSKIFSLSEQYELPKIIPSCDIFWSPYMNIPFFSCKAKYRVVTLHDVFHLANPQYYSLVKRLFIKPFYYFSTRKSDLILTVSNFSKREIARCCGETFNDKIHVVYNGCDIEVGSVKAVSKPFEYILFVGSVKPHKNLKNALLGFELMAQQKLKFVIVGKKEGFITGDKDVFGVVDKLNKDTESVIFTGNISDDELFEWYKGATALIQPSFYEGFGLPIVEAMKFGLPIACSDIPVFKEIGKDLVSYFDPYSPNSIATCLENVVNMPKKEYPNWISWEETAKQIAEEFEKMVSK